MTNNSHLETMQRAVDALFRRLGKPVWYLNYAGCQQAVLVIIKQPDQLVSFQQTQLQTGTEILEVRTREVPQPQLGEQFQLADRRLTIQAKQKKDQHQLVWQLELVAS